MENALNINYDFEKEVEKALNGRENIIHRIQNMFPNNKIIPTREAHEHRQHYNDKPKGNLICLKRSQKYKKYRIFKDDETGLLWHEMPWYFNIFHKPSKQIKLLHFDKDHEDKAKGSSEIYVMKTDIVKHKNNVESINIEKIIWKEASFNFRDFNSTNHTAHFFADILPEAIYYKSKCCK